MMKMVNGMGMSNKSCGKTHTPQPQAPATPQPATAATQPNPDVEDLKMKKAALYEATYHAWVNTNIEADKTIITIASGGIGLLVALINVIEVKSNTDIYCYIFAIGTFIISIGAGIFIFKRNPAVLVKSLNKNYKKDRWLGVADAVVIISFSAGLLLTTYIGLKASVGKLAKTAVEAKTQSDNKNVPSNINIKSLSVDTLTVKHLNYSSAKPNKRR